MDRSHKGSLEPELSFSDPSGKRVRLASFRGKPLLLSLWATWCAPCVTEMPTLDKLAASSGGRFKVLSVSQDMQPAAVAPFFAEHRFKALEPWLDPQNDLAFHYNSPLPTTVYYDAEGRELWRVVGGFDWTGEQAAKLLSEAS